MVTLHILWIFILFFYQSRGCAESQLLWDWEVNGAKQTHLLSCLYVRLGALHHSTERAAFCQPAPSTRTGHRILAPATVEGQLLRRRKWVSAGTNLLPVFLFFPFLPNGKQSEQFLRTRDINLPAAIYNVLVTTVSKCLKYTFTA